MPPEDAWQQVHHASITSTQQEARRMLMASSAPLHRWAVTADRQTSGLGRRGGRFESPKGGAYQTLVLHETSLAWRVAPSVAVGMAYEVAWRLQQEGIAGAVKWPNDVYVTGLKAGGILMERHAGHLLIGVGLNALNDPPPGATRLNRPPDEVRRWVQDAWDALDRAHGRWQARREDVPHVLNGLDVRVAGASGRVTGVANDGTLQLKQQDGGTVHASAGHVELLPSGS
jgi:BirA family biotin operon repressor/biotin-[acetyl-CoA-carboxylase] ligase